MNRHATPPEDAGGSETSADDGVDVPVGPAATLPDGFAPEIVEPGRAPDSMEPRADRAPDADPEPRTGTPEPSDSRAAGRILDELTEVRRQLADFHRRSAHRESVIDRLHAENQQLRGGVRRAVLEPVVTDLIRLFDQIDREGRRLGDASSGALLRSFADDVALILDRCGMEVFAAEPGDPFQPDRHRPLSVVPTEDEAAHNTVAEIVSAGFTDRETGRVRRPLQARFHRYTPSADAEEGH